MNAPELWLEFPERYDTPEKKWSLINRHIHELLISSNWSQLPDALLTPTQKAEWDTYRETLFNIPFNFASPELVIFPDAPVISSNPPSAELLQAIARRKASLGNMALVVELKTVTQDQAANYVQQQITNGILEANALAQFDQAGTFAAAKPIIRNMLIGMYRTVDILKLIARLLVAIRDYIRPFQN